MPWSCVRGAGQRAVLAWDRRWWRWLVVTAWGLHAEGMSGPSVQRADGGRASTWTEPAGPRCRRPVVSRVAMRLRGPRWSSGVIALELGRALTLFRAAGLDLPGEEESVWTPHRTYPGCTPPVPPTSRALVFLLPGEDARPGRAGTGWNEPRAGRHTGRQAGGRPRCVACPGGRQRAEPAGGGRRMDV